MIRILDKSVAGKIAAGEVVERPLSIVKELVENAIDAGADTIIAEIKNGGKSYIRVTDNGEGIESGQVKLAFLRHATSKISTDSDLEHVETLGFRGEALASIAAVSRCEMITKTRSEKMGTSIVIEGGDLASFEPVGCPGGTTIVVSELFYNTPARQKFMRSDAAEGGPVIDFFSKMAIAYPSIKMRLINNGSVLFSTRGTGDPLNAILTVYDGETGKNLVPVDKEENGLKISGYTSKQGFSKSNKRGQVFFVNGRNISGKTMEKGVSEAYADKLFVGRYSVCFLFLQMAPEKLDVNIHPNKKEVRFENDNEVSGFIRQAIREALLVKEAIPEVKMEKVFKLQEKEQEPVEQTNIINLLSTITEQPDSDYIKETPVAFTAHEFNMRELSVTGTVFSSYVTACDESALYLIDQHAAHERILYEKMMDQYNAAEKSSQILLLPFVTEASVNTQAGDFTCIDALREAGFEIEEFGAKSYVVKAVPMFLDIPEAQDFIERFFESVKDSTDFKDAKTIEKIMSNACKSAVKAGDRVNSAEAAQLLFDLSKCENPYNCPHGRPTFIRLTKDEIEKMFKRK